VPGNTLREVSQYATFPGHVLKDKFHGVYRIKCIRALKNGLFPTLKWGIIIYLWSRKDLNRNIH
jgi:hypothetical protein